MDTIKRQLLMKEWDYTFTDDYLYIVYVTTIKGTINELVPKENTSKM